MTTPYADAATYLALVPSEPSPSDTTGIDLALAQASRAVDRYCSRFFSQDASPVARIFRPRVFQRRLTGSFVAVRDWAEVENPYLYGYVRLLHVDDLAAAPAEVIVDQGQDGSFVGDTALTSNDYELWPPNAALGPEPWPFTALFVQPQSAFGGFPDGAEVRVTARWGWPSVPAPVVQATCQLAGLARLAFDPSLAAVKTKQLANGPLISYSDAAGGGDLPVPIKEMLAQYRRAPLL